MQNWQSVVLFFENFTFFSKAQMKTGFSKLILNLNLLTRKKQNSKGNLGEATSKRY